MSTYGAQFWDAAGNLTFDTTAEHTLFHLDEHYIDKDTVGTGLTYSYPALTGKKIVAFMQSPYGGSDSPGQKIQQCRVTYPSGVPTVTVTFGGSSVDSVGYTYPLSHGYLIVFSCGANQ